MSPEIVNIAELSRSAPSTIEELKGDLASIDEKVGSNNFGRIFRSSSSIKKRAKAISIDVVSPRALGHAIMKLTSPKTSPKVSYIALASNETEFRRRHMSDVCFFGSLIFTSQFWISISRARRFFFHPFLYLFMYPIVRCNEQLEPKGYAGRHGGR